MRHDRLFGHVRRRLIDTHLKRVDGIKEIFSKRNKERPRKTWWKTLRHYYGHTKDIAIDRNS